MRIGEFNPLPTVFGQILLRVQSPSGSLAPGFLDGAPIRNHEAELLGEGGSETAFVKPLIQDMAQPRIGVLQTL